MIEKDPLTSEERKKARERIAKLAGAMAKILKKEIKTNVTGKIKIFR